MLVRRGYRYRIYPTPAQVERLGAWEDALRWLWNLALEQRLVCLGRCTVDRVYLSALDQMKELVELRALCPWLADVPRNVCDHVLKTLDLAWQRCFVGLAAPPRWKKKGRDQVNLTEPHPHYFRVEGQTVVFPKLGAIAAVVHRPLAGTPKQCTVLRDGDAWYVSILCEQEVADPAPRTAPVVALDRGVTNVVADSDGNVVVVPRPLERRLKELARAQRVVARRKKGSKNQQKARARVARIQRTVRRQRDHVLHEISARYAKSHGVIVVEALKVRSMTASARGTAEEPGVNVRQKAGLNRGILDAGWTKLVTQVTYKVAATGGRVLAVPAAYSSQTCAACGVVDGASRRRQAEFQCVACGHTAHADVNAAEVLLARGLRVLAVEATATVCGGVPSAGPTKQKLRVVRRGTKTGERSDGVITKAPDFSLG